MYFKENDLMYYMTCSCTGKVHINITADAMFTSCFSAIFFTVYKSHCMQTQMPSAARSLTSLPSTGLAVNSGTSSKKSQRINSFKPNRIPH